MALTLLLERSGNEGFTTGYWLLATVYCFMNVRSILLPTDFSECARHAVPAAAEFARLWGARVLCLHVVEPVVPAVGWTPMAEPLPVPDVSGRLEDSAARELPRFAGCEEFEGLDVEDLIAHGEPAAEIVRAAKERGADLIVISSHGRTGLGRIIFGSTAEAVVRHAPCPVPSKPTSVASLKSGVSSQDKYFAFDSRLRLQTQLFYDLISSTTCVSVGSRQSSF